MTKYNVGDRVKVTSVNSPEHAGDLIGKTGTVRGSYREYPGNFDIEVMLDGIGNRVFKDSHVELVERAKKFKVGDEVIITGVQPFANKDLIGKTGTINGGELGWYADDEHAYCVTIGDEDDYGFYESQMEFKEIKKAEDTQYYVSIDNVSKDNVEDLTSLLEQFIDIMEEVPDSGNLGITVGKSTISIYRDLE